MENNNDLPKFDQRLNSLEPHIINMLSEIDIAKGEIKGAISASPHIIDSLHKTVLITSAGASTRIEGSNLSDEEVAKIMDKISYSKFNDRDSQEVQGYLETLQNIFENPIELSLREGTIKSLHNQLLKYSDKDNIHKGEYKKNENIVGIVNEKGEIKRILFNTTPAYLVKKEMDDLVEWANNAFENKRFHNLLIIANFIIQFLKIHPFEDGNGRASRILTNLLLLQTGYSFVKYISHEKIIEERKKEYYIALRTSQETFNTEKDNIKTWLNFFLSVIKEQGEKAVAILKQDNIENLISKKQSLVLNCIKHNPEISLSAIVEETNVARGTVRQALDRLLKLNKIKRIGQGRATRYISI